MANEISSSVSFTVTNGNYSRNIRVNGSYNQNALGVWEEVVSVPTTATSYTFSSLTTDGWAFLQNNDATNYVTWGLSVSGTYYPVGKIEAGEFSLLRLNPGLAFQMQSNTASCQVQITVWND